MNRRGFLLGEETVKIILAVIAISFLAYFLISLYYSSVRNQELELAKSSLERLDKEIRAGKEQVEIYNPNGWYLSSWSLNIAESGETNEIFMPKKCSNQNWENCICICKRGFNFRLQQEPALCDDEGTCIESDFVIRDKDVSWIKLNDLPLKLNINSEEKILTKNGS